MAAPVPTFLGATVIGAQRMVYGTLTNDSTGGAFSTGLKHVTSFNITPEDPEDDSACKVELNTAVGGDVTITVTSGEFGIANWSATGYGGG